jgi:type II secretory pathway pseudopilin PulG
MPSNQQQLGGFLSQLLEQLVEQDDRRDRQRLQQQQQQQQQLQQQLQQQQRLQQQQGGQQQIAGNVKVYTGPKEGKFIINKHAKKVYIDRKTLNNNLPYVKKNAKKGKAKVAK